MNLEKVFWKQRKKFEESSAIRAQEYGRPNGVIEYQNIPYANDENPAHKMDIFLPGSKGFEPLPVIINVHGGGMILGNKEFNRHFCAQLAKRGFLVCCMEYSLVPEVYIYTQLQEITMAMETLRQLLPKYEGDSNHVYVVGDSAGAYLAVYTAAIQKSAALAKAARVKPSQLRIRALGLISGMFYTTKFDKIGICMPKYLYGEHYKQSAFAPYVNIENKEILTALPPVFLVTSRKDSLRRYTFKYEKALCRYQKKHELLYFKQRDKKLAHAFSVFEPYQKESLDTIEKLLEFLRKY